MPSLSLRSAMPGGEARGPSRRGPRPLEPPTPPPANPRNLVFQKAVSVAHEAEAAQKEPAFEAVLMCKPSRDGGVGDCPFTQYARMSLVLSGTPHATAPTAPSAKPRWLLEGTHGGSLPCWAPGGAGDGRGAVSESSKIAALHAPPGERDAAVLERTAALFGAIAGLVKGGASAASVERAGKVDGELAKLEALLGDGAPGPYLAGAKPGLSDCSVSTKLYVLFVAGGHYEGFLLDARYPRIARYWTAISAHAAFYSTRYDEDEMLFGWGEARGGGR